MPLRLQREPRKPAVAVVQAETDWLKGADKGPAAILAASANMELFDIETGSEVYRRGIFTAEPVTENRTPEAMVAAVRERVSGFLEREQFVVTVGGEHSVTIGAVQAHAARYPDLCVLQLDAHADLRDAYEGSPFNHACVMARVREQCEAYLEELAQD